MTDVSDGLVADLGHIARASGVGIDLSTACAGRRPRSPSPRAGAAVAVDAWDWVLGGGEDHALVATFPGSPPAGWRVIGGCSTARRGSWWTARTWHGDPGWQSF